MAKFKTYSISGDTLNSVLDQDALDTQLKADATLKNVYDGINRQQGSDNFNVHLIVERTTELDTAMDTVVAAHDGVALTVIDTVQLKEQDSETGGVMITPRYQPQGWLQQLFEIEFETSKKDSIHEKDIENNDIGWSSLKFYKLDAGNEVEIVDPTQAELDTDCIRTDFIWQPTVDYQILSGQVAQKISPASDFYVWGAGIDLDPAYGGPKAIFAEGGINLAYVDGKQAVGLKGKGAPFLYTDKVKSGVDAEGNPTFTAVPTGVGSNRMRFVCRHDAGFKHRLQPIFEIFRAPS